MEVWRTPNPATGTDCYLTHDQWAGRIIVRHPEVEPHLDHLRQAAADPAVAYRNDETILKYSRVGGGGKYNRLWYLVVERPDSDGDYRVVTAYFIDRVEGETLVYAREALFSGR